MQNISKLRDELKLDGYALLRYDDGAVHSFPYDSPWLTDKAFNAIYDLVREHTLVDRTRAYSIYLLADQAKKLPGDVLEVGTWRGGTAGILASVLPMKTIYLADTFKGVVKASEWEHYKDHAHSDTSEKIVRNLLQKNLNTNNFQILKGIFPEDTGGSVAKKKLALVYLDVDVYESTKDAFNFVWKQVVKGGLVAFDDYGMISACEGISRFVNEIRNDKDKLFIQNLNGQAYIIKI